VLITFHGLGSAVRLGLCPSITCLFLPVFCTDTKLYCSVPELYVGVNNLAVVIVVVIIIVVVIVDHNVYVHIHCNLSVVYQMS